MNKKTVLKIKKGIAYEKCNPDKELLLKAIKKTYPTLTQKEKARFFIDLKKISNPSEIKQK